MKKKEEIAAGRGRGIVPCATIAPSVCAQYGPLQASAGKSLLREHLVDLFLFGGMVALMLMLLICLWKLSLAETAHV